MTKFKMLAGLGSAPPMEKEHVVARPKGGKSNFKKKKPSFFGKK